MTAQRTYVGALYEKEFNASNSETKHIYYIFAGGGAIAIHTESATAGSETVYLHKDHLGSIAAITDAAGALKQELSYDAWGNRRNPATWAIATVTPLFARGFTGHEHLDLFSLVNMNGRIYDPVIGRFLSPDPCMQAPDFTQGLNRYIYCLNAPLSMIDPSGYKWWHWVLGGALLGIIPPGVVESAATSFAATTSANMSFAFLCGFVSHLEKEPKGGVGDDGYSKWRITKKSWDDGAQRARNSWRLSMGLFKADEEGTTSFNQFW